MKNRRIAIAEADIMVGRMATFVDFFHNRRGYILLELNLNNETMCGEQGGNVVLLSRRSFVCRLSDIFTSLEFKRILLHFLALNMDTTTNVVHFYLRKICVAIIDDVFFCVLKNKFEVVQEDLKVRVLLLQSLLFN